MYEELQMNNLEEQINNEAKINGNYIPLDCIGKYNKTICQILINGKIKGTGFFCKIKKPLKNKSIKVLLTCYHVLNIEDQMINEITYKIGNEEKILNLENRLKPHSKDLDFTCIQIHKEDNIEEYLEIDEKIIDNKLEEYEGKKIYTVGFPGKGGLDTGDILSLQKEHRELFTHNCNTEHGWSGGPIFSKENNKVIGLHKGSYRKTEEKQFNVGIFINYILNDINNKNIDDLLDDWNEKEINNKYNCSNIRKVINKYKITICVVIVVGFLLGFLIYEIMKNKEKGTKNDEDRKKIDEEKTKID